MDYVLVERRSILRIFRFSLKKKKAKIKITWREKRKKMLRNEWNWMDGWMGKLMI